MRKLMKYELMGSFRYILGLIAGIIVLNSLVLYKIRPGSSLFKQGGQWGLAFLILFGAVLVCMIEGVLIYRKDLFSETGYLIFTTPNTSAAIVGAKILCFLIELLPVVFIGGAYVIRDCYVLDSATVNRIVGDYKYPLFLCGLFCLIAMLALVVIAYLSISISKTVIGNRKFSKLVTLVLFVFIVWAFGRVSYELVFHIFDGVLQRINDYNVIWPGIITVAIYFVVVFAGNAALITKKLDI